jgi:hypothetical protein
MKQKAIKEESSIYLNNENAPTNRPSSMKRVRSSMKRVRRESD